MIKTVIASTETTLAEAVKFFLYTYCPQITIKGVVSTWTELLVLFQKQKPDLIFVEKEIASFAGDHLFGDHPGRFEVIILHSGSELDSMVLSNFEVGHLFNPLRPKEFITTVHNMLRLIRWKRELLESRKLLHQLIGLLEPNDRVGIPTMEGMVFLKVEEILRCEGLHRFTRVFTTKGTSIISSYNIGEFCKFLCHYGFFAPHKSHLINLQHITKYEAEGTILLQDGSHVPVSRRRKSQFLECVKHI